MYKLSMAFSKSDLSDIKRAVKEVTEPRFKGMEKRLSGLEKGQANLESSLKTLKKGQKKIQKDLDTIVVAFDNEYIRLKKRVVKIESHLGIQPAEF